MEAKVPLKCYQNPLLELQPSVFCKTFRFKSNRYEDVEAEEVLLIEAAHEDAATIRQLISFKLNHGSTNVCGELVAIQRKGDLG